MEKNGSHNYTIDLLRGLAALSVGFYHLAASNDFLSGTSWLRAVSSHGHIGVQVFFIISGFVIPLSMYKVSYTFSDFKAFILKRIIRIEPPYLVMVIVCPLLWYFSSLLSSYQGKPFVFDWLQFASHFGYLTELLSYDWLNPVFWTLAIEFQFYLLIALLFPYLKKFNGNLLTLSLLVSAGLFDLGRPFLFSHLLFFDLGILIFLQKNSLIKKKWFWSFVLVIFTVLVIKGNSIVVLISLLAFLLILFTNIKTKIGSFLGLVSYSFYLIHVPVGVRVVNFLSRFVSNENIKVLVILAGMLIALFVAYIFYRIVEKPALLLSRKVLDKRKKEREPLVESVVEERLL